MHMTTLQFGVVFSQLIHPRPRLKRAMANSSGEFTWTVAKSAPVDTRWCPAVMFVAL